VAGEGGQPNACVTKLHLDAALPMKAGPAAAPGGERSGSPSPFAKASTSKFTIIPIVCGTKQDMGSEV